MSSGKSHSRGALPNLGKWLAPVAFPRPATMSCRGACIFPNPEAKWGQEPQRTGPPRTENTESEGSGTTEPIRPQTNHGHCRLKRALPPQSTLTWEPFAFAVATTRFRIEPQAFFTAVVDRPWAALRRFTAQVRCPMLGTGRVERCLFQLGPEAMVEHVPPRRPRRQLSAPDLCGVFARRGVVRRHVRRGLKEAFGP